MYLSKIDIFGFKSFAHKVAFQFNDGITAIIGPNGCGKSNIVDAIRWVLGEQRTSILRLDRMDNIIFNGTALRKPLSMVEVSLLIENTKNILPSIYSEVKITRRLYRSGDSEYLLNNRQVRLKDIIDLFADTGMGSDAYSVIELKMVEQILSDNAEERRRLFEEAAGIKKYKFRRKSAMRKLEATQQELVRLSDVISEVQKNVNSLSRQVGKARRYHEYKNELKQNEIYVFQLRSSNYEQSLIPLREEYEQVRETRERLGKEVNTGEAELEKLQVRAVGLEGQFREVTARLNKSDEEVRELQQKVRLSEQIIESDQKNIDEKTREIENLNNRITELKQQLASLNAAKESNTNEVAAQEKLLQEKLLQHQQAENKLETTRKKFQEFRDNNLHVFEEISSQRENLQKISIELKNSQEQQSQFNQSRRKYEEELKIKQQKHAELSLALGNAEKDLTQYQKEINHLKKSITHLEAEVEGLENRHNQVLGENEKLKSRREFLENLIENYEGFSESVQFVMSRKQEYNGLIDTLANLVDTGEEYRTALESYLEEVANYLVVEKVDTARDIINTVRQQNKGRLTLVPLPLLKTSRNGKPDISQLKGKIVPLKDVVKFDSRYQKLFDYLFDRVILVEDIESALTWHKEYPDFKFLTREGDLLGEWGKITGGNSQHYLNLTGRKDQYQKVQKRQTDLEKELNDLKNEIETKRKELSDKRKRQDEFTGMLAEQQKEISQLTQEIHQQSFEIKRYLENIDELSTGLNTASQKIAELQEQEIHLKPAVQESERRQQAFREEESRLTKETDAADHNFRELSKQTQQFQIDFINKQNQVKEIAQQIEFAQKTLEETHARIETNRKDIEVYRNNIGEKQIEIDQTGKILEGLYGSRDIVEKEKLKVENNYQGLKSVIMAREDEIKKLHRRWNQALERLKELELGIQEYEIKLKTQREQLDEQWGEQFESMLAENPVPANLTLEEVQEVMIQLREKIESLGEVNPLAIKEHEKEKERLDFLKAQESDLLNAKEELLETISKLNKTARKLFMDTFEQINQNFMNVFSKFFEGGEAELRLLENGDPLEANIDISVRIKGKRLSTLNLMSAGEKTLTAISLLFAIYLYKPSPFCILDEVDAPLDDVNISRYTRALKEFSRNTQFILVTHNKMTMQAAEAMYGITMEEPGVSKVVSVKFN
jgi:chromosome segregation protein